MFDLRMAKYFVAVAEELHFGRAAERLQMSQPPLSQAIRHLERAVGTQLFARTNRHVALTPAGLAFLPECRELLRRAEVVARTPRLAARGVRAQVTVGAVASAFIRPLPAALAELRRDAPHLDVTVREIDTHEVVSGLRHGRFDLALARVAASTTGVRTRTLVDDGFHVLLPGGHPLGGETTEIDLGRLSEDPWVWIEREVSPDYHDDMGAACRAAGFSPAAAHTARSIASQIALVRCGVGVTIIPSTMADGLPPDVTARPAGGSTKTVTLAISTRTDPGVAEALVESAVVDAVARGRHGQLSPGAGAALHGEDRPRREA